MKNYYSLGGVLIALFSSFALSAQMESHQISVLHKASPSPTIENIERQVSGSRVYGCNHSSTNPRVKTVSAKMTENVKTVDHIEGEKVPGFIYFSQSVNPSNPMSRVVPCKNNRGKIGEEQLHNSQLRTMSEMTYNDFESSERRSGKPNVDQEEMPAQMMGNGNGSCGFKQLVKGMLNPIDDFEGKAVEYSNGSFEKQF